MRLALMLCFLGLLFNCVLDAQGINGFPLEKAVEPDSSSFSGLGCWVSMVPYGPPVAYVPQSDGTSNATYWLNYSATDISSTLKFLVKFNNGSPLQKHIQKLGTVGGMVTTPFAYPLWTNNLVMGPAILKVTNDVGRCSYSFILGGKAFESSDTPDIPNPGTLGSEVLVGGIGTIEHVSVALSIVYPNDDDLSLSLVGPDGTTVVLSSNNGGSEDDYGYTGFRRTVFDDGAPISITAGSAPFIGMFRPEGTLSTFIGKSGIDVNGKWTLKVIDNEGLVAGHVEAWALIIAD